jgi:hypothetical protein
MLTAGRMMSDCPIWSHYLSARHVAIAAEMSLFDDTRVPSKQRSGKLQKKRPRCSGATNAADHSGTQGQGFWVARLPCFRFPKAANFRNSEMLSGRLAMPNKHFLVSLDWA